MKNTEIEGKTYSPNGEVTGYYLKSPYSDKSVYYPLAPLIEEMTLFTDGYFSADFSVDLTKRELYMNQRYGDTREKGRYVNGRAFMIRLQLFKYEQEGHTSNIKSEVDLSQ